MRNFISFVLTILISILILGCKQKKFTQVKTSSIVNITDTIFLPGLYNFQYLDINKKAKLLLLYDINNNSLYQYSLLNKEVTNIRLPGFMDDKMIPPYTFKAAGYDENLIYVITHKGYYELDLNGEIKSFQNIISKPLFSATKNLALVENKNEKILFHSGGKYDYERDNSLNYNTSRLFSQYIWGEEERSYTIPFEKEIIESKPKGNFNYRVIFKEEDGTLYLGIDPDNHLFVYDISDSITLSNSYKLNLNHFREVKEPRNNPRLLFSESSINSIIPIGDQVFVHYQANTPEEVLFESMEDFPKRSEIYKLWEKIDTYMAIFNENGEKLMPEILIPKDVFKVLTSFQENLFLAQANPTMIEDDRGGIIYVLSLSENGIFLNNSSN